MILNAFTLVHVLISLGGIFSGLVVLSGMLKAKRLEGWTKLFLITTVLTSVTGFFFPVDHFMPSHAVGILSLIVLSLAIFARYGRKLSGRWRSTYVITAMMAEYFNCFVLVAQLFAKVPFLHALAPTQAEPPFGLAQLAVLALFTVVTFRAVVGFRGISPLGRDALASVA